MTTRDIIIFLSGLAGGAGIATLISKTYYKNKYSKIADEQIAEMEEYYGRSDEYVRGISEEGEQVNPSGDIEDEDAYMEYGNMTPEQKAEIREKLQRNNRETANYAAMYKGAAIDDAVKEELGKDELESQEQEAHEEHEKNKNRPPKIISAEALGEVPAHYEERDLLFYMYDEIVTDDEDNVIEEPERLIGDAIDKYGFRSNDETMIFVQNFELSAVYTVQKVMASFGEGE